MKKRKVIYSNNQHTKYGIFSFILSMIVLISLLASLIISYIYKGNTPNSYGAVGFLCTLFSGIGIVLALIGKKEQDKYFLFANLGLGFNIFDLLFISAILYAGI